VTRFADYARLSWNNLIHRRTRSLLTIVGIFIGIAAVVALISIGEGLQNAVVGEFEKMGSDKITVMSVAAGGIQSPFAGEMSGNPLTEDDVRNIAKVRGVKLVGGALMKSGVVKYGSETASSFVMGIPTDTTQKIFEDMQQVEVAQGRKLKNGDSGKVLVGSYFADGLFKRKAGVGEKITINGRDYQIVGVLASMGNKMDDSSVILTDDAARDLFNEPDAVSMIYAQTDASAEPAQVAERIEEKLRKTRHEEEGSETFSVSTSEQLLSSFSSILGVVQAMIVGIAAISLLVGGIGIMNTMYTSVLERTREIGIMKAIGAQNNDVLMLFLLESGALGVIGGIVGVLIGMGLGKITEIIAAQALGSGLLKASFAPELIFGALLFSFLIGSLSGALPAMQAAKMKPVDSLRYE